LFFIFVDGVGVEPTLSGTLFLNAVNILTRCIF